MAKKSKKHDQAAPKGSKKAAKKRAKRVRELERLHAMPRKKKCCRSDPRCKKCPVRIKKRIRKLEGKLGD